MQINKNRDVITLEQTLAYIKYLNRQKPFNKDQVLIPTKDYEEITQANHQKITTPKQKLKKIKLDHVDDEDATKKINKNRAIKRIIESAYQILQNFKNYEEEVEEKKGDKSSDIQFNIYLKQYNRVLEMIHNTEKGRLNREGNKTEKEEELLQSIYEYTVVEDFREILPVAILKDKISKNNVQIMIKALTESLVVLRSNQLRVYDSPTSFGPYKAIKLHQIENVDYHTQPYIFIVLTIQKDKERFNIYLKFQSQKTQQKWDRALYCCYIGRKMKTKQKFFLLEYPEEDVKKKEKEQTKKLAAFNYQIQGRKKPLDKIFNQGKTISISSKKQMQEESRSRSNTPGRKMSIQRSNVNKNSSKQQQIQETVPLMQRTASQLGLGAKSNIRSNKLTQNETDTIKGGMTDSNIMNRNKTDNIQVNKSQQQLPHDLTQRSMVKKESFSQIGEENKEKTIQNERYIQKQILPQDIRHIHDIQRKNVRGMIFQKERFFFNKSKIIYLKENRQKNQQGEVDIDVQSEYEAMRQRQIEYWDFDNKSGQKTQRKTIKMVNVVKFQLKQEKYLSIVHENNKQIIFIGDINLLKELLQWMRLITYIYKNKIIPKNVNPT